MAYRFSGKVSSELTAIHSLIHRILNEVDVLLDEDELFNLRLIMSELMINGAEHGNHNDREKSVYLDLVIGEDAIELSVTDEGQGLNHELLEQQEANLMSCSGRGLMIVHSLSDQLTFANSTIKCELGRR